MFPHRLTTRVTICLLGEEVVESTVLPKLVSNSLFQVILLPQFAK